MKKTDTLVARDDGEELLRGGEQRAERRRVIVPAAALQVRLADQFSRWQSRQAYAFSREVSLIGVAQCGGGSRKPKPAPAAAMNEREEALEAQHTFEGLRREADSRLEATTQLAVRHKHRCRN